ncbi:MAG: hypothetical protein PHC51_01740 [bacterium]|nr:hypothetical protein [bacterium]
MTNRSIFSRIFIFSCCMSFYGCSLFESAAVENTVARRNDTEFFSPLLADDHEKPPLEFRLVNAVSDGKFIYIVVSVTALADLPAQLVHLSAVGLNHGQVIREEVRRLSDAIGEEIIPKGGQADILFELPAAQVEDYQVRVDWNLRKSEQNQGSVEQLILRNVETEIFKSDCVAEVCSEQHAVSATVFNQSKTGCSNISVAIGVFWSDENFPAQVMPINLSPLSDHEEKVSLGAMTLFPGEGRRVRLRIERHLPILSGGKFSAHLRILDYSCDAG